MRVVALCLLVFGCASVERKPPVGDPAMASKVLAADGKPTGLTAGTGPKGKFVCERETETGSNYRKQVCRYVDYDWESAERREQTHQALRELEIGACTGAGCGGR